MKSLRILPALRTDIDESYDWYVNQSSEAALKFENAVRDAFASILSDPLRFQKVGRRHRRSPVTGFKFNVIFRIEAAELVIVAVAHTSRRPGYWHRR